MTVLMNSKLFFSLLIATLVFTCFVINLVKRDILAFKYALLWIFTSVISTITVLYQPFAVLITHVLGIGLVVNAIYLVVIFLLIAIIFSLTVSISKINRRILLLTQELALTRYCVDFKGD